MRNTATFQKKACPIAVRCLTSILYFFLFSLSSLAACVDKEPVDEEDADPAINPYSSYLEEEESGGNTSSGPAFPVLANYAPAFPGAVGYGRNADGARGSNNREIYVVTNLNNSGAGSLRDAVSQANRIIVFNVSGVIDLNKEVLVFKDNQTVLFQTAPGDGIELYNGRTSSTNANNLIVRYMRMRTGRQVSGSDNIDAGGAAYGHDQIYDHCSFTWGTDECFSLNNDKQPKGLYNITLQNSILGQGCQNHSCGGLVQTSDEEGVTVFRNLFIDNKTRNFKVKGLNQFVNNVIYNWTGEGAYGAQGGSYNIINNYYKPGPVNAAKKTHCRIFTAYVDDGKNQQAKGVYGKFYVNGNYFETYDKLSASQKTEAANANADNTSSTAFVVKNNEIPSQNLLVSSRFPILDDYSFVQTAQNAYKAILQYAGASNIRDNIDKRIVDETEKGTFTYTDSSGGANGLIDTQTDVEGWSEYVSAATTQQDSDKDGIPDEWETANGLNPNDGNDGNKYNLNKEYTNLEVYLNSLVNSLYPTNN